MTKWVLEGYLDETKQIKQSPIEQFPFSIGRSRAADLLILCSGISRRHAEIVCKNDTLYLRDLGSTNGSFVDSQRVTGEMRLKHNAKIHFAQVEYRIFDEDYHDPHEDQLTRVLEWRDATENEPSPAAAEPQAEHHVSSREPSPLPELVAAKNERRAMRDALDDGENGAPPEQVKPEQIECDDLADIEAKLAGLDMPVNQEPPFSSVDQAGLLPVIETEGTEGASEPDTPEFEARQQGSPSVKKSSQNKLAYKVPANDKVHIKGRWDAPQNRRRHMRREAHWSALVTLPNQEQVRCHTRDLSEQGMALSSPANLPVGTLVRIEIDAYHEGARQTLVALGKVKHSLMKRNQFVVGILIHRCDTASARFLKAFSNFKI